MVDEEHFETMHFNKITLSARAQVLVNKTLAIYTHGNRDG